MIAKFPLSTLRECVNPLRLATRISTIATGVDLDYFAPPAAVPLAHDLVFVGSMDWMPNIDAVNYFLDEIFPRITALRPGTTLAIVGRTPTPELRARASRDARITVTGTVPDVRPWLWGARLSVVPLRIGGGTRLKIYEAMAAHLPVVSTSVGAEGHRPSIHRTTFAWPTIRRRFCSANARTCSKTNPHAAAWRAAPMIW